MNQYIGKILNDRYELLDVLGVGGMAVVYRAKCHRLNRQVAVKVLKPELAADTEIRNRFHDESKAVGMMSHPNIVNVYDVNQDGEIDYFVMELVEGITLKQYIGKRGGVLNWREALHFMVQIMQALGHAHSRGIIHRDIKPQNIMVLKDGSVKVADFGIARIADSQQTMTQEALGSVHYISPEQARGSRIDARSDIYSAGVVLYEMLTGRLPYEGDSPIAVAMQHINSIPLTPREQNAEIPVGMEQITMKCMAQNRDLRYSNAEAVLEDLGAFRRNPSIVFEFANPWKLPDFAAEGEQGNGDEWKPLAPSVVDMGDTTVSKVNRTGKNAQEDEGKLPEESEDEDDEGGGGHRAAIIIGCGVVAILVVIFIIFRMLFTSILGDMLDGGTEYTVPDMRGLTYAEAEAQLFKDETLREHFTLTQSDKTIYDESYDLGEIISQEPEGNTITKQEKTEIILYVRGEKEVEQVVQTMPDLKCEDYETWADQLSQKYGVIVRYQPEYSSKYDAGKIISTSPSAGATLNAGQTVTLTYSKGSKKKTVTMVSLVGMTENEAKKAISELGLECGHVVTVEDTAEAGTVVFQSVKAKAEVELGTSVDLQISTGPKPQEETPVLQLPENKPPEEQQEEQEPEEWEQEPEEPEQDNTWEDGTQWDDRRTIVVTMPEGRTEMSSLSIKVNGQTYYSATVAPDQTQVSAMYKGTIESIEVTVDGNIYREYEVR